MTMVTADHGVEFLTNERFPASFEDSPIRVLLVEDDAAVRETLCSMLESRGYLVVAAQNGPAGLKLAQDFPGSFDLLLTDVHMPEMKGPELARQLHILRPGLSVLYMSANPSDAFSACQADPGAGFLVKPFSCSGLVQGIDSVLAAQRANFCASYKP
jgi:CheY-like chemotaxis protein